MQVAARPKSLLPKRPAKILNKGADTESQYGIDTIDPAVVLSTPNLLKRIEYKYDSKAKNAPYSRKQWQTII